MDDTQLAAWLRAVELEPGSDRQAAIGQAAEKFVSTVTPSAILGLVELAHGCPDESAFILLRDGIADIDPTFGCAIDDLETRLAASVFAAEVLAADALIAIPTAHSVLSAKWSGLQSPATELSQIAERTLAQRAEAVRVRVPFTFGVDTSAILTALPTFPDDGGAMTHQEGNKFRVAISEVADTMSAAVDDATKRATGRLDASDEELNLLWWAFSGRSNVEDRPWSRITNDGLAAILMGIEFGGLVKFPAEPLATRELLSRLLGAKAGHTVSLSNAVSAVGKREVLNNAPRGHRLLPVLSSLGESRALAGKKAWTDSVARWSIDVSRETTSLDLACQTVRETLLVKQLI